MVAAPWEEAVISAISAPQGQRERRLGNASRPIALVTCEHDDLHR